MRMFLIALSLLLLPLPAMGADFSVSGVLSTDREGIGNCQVRGSGMDFSADNGKAPEGRINFSGQCGGKSVSLDLPAVAGSVKGSEFTGVYAGLGKFAGSEFPIRMTVMGQINGKRIEGDAVFSFNDMVYSAGKFRGTIK